ncbi:long-chain fatty acid transporter fat1 [Savitreella phatthalungensis]
MVDQSSVIKALVAGLGVMYVDAKYFVGHDLNGVRSILRARRNVASREAADVCNNFYVIEDHLKSRPDAVMLVYGSREWTYKQAMTEILRWANYLISLDLKSGDLVALNFTNRPAFVFAFCGAWAAGVVPALINFNLVDNALAHCVKVSTAKVMIFDDEAAKNVSTAKDLLPGVKFICYSEDARADFAENITAADLSRQPLSRPPNSRRGGQKMTSPAALIYTSGSTGLPKAAIVPWAKYGSSAVASSGLIGITQSDRFYTCMPLYHGTANILGFGSCLAVGATFCLGHRFSNKTFWPEVRQTRATIIQYVGEVCRYLLAVPPSPLDGQHNVRMAYGNGMRPDVWERFRQRFKIPTITEFYASTEGVGGSFNHNSNSLGAGAVGKLGSLGRALSQSYAIVKVDTDTEELVRDKNGLCVLCGPGEPGELMYVLEEGNAERAFVGYFGNQKASDSKLIRNVAKKGDLYMRMGDLMSVDADGFTYFHDRLGDTFRWKGENVSTTEVAEAIGSFPGIAEANVYGVQLPNHDGRAGCAAVDLDPSTKVDWEKLGQHVAKALPKYAVPLFVRITRMQSTGNYKQQKVGLRNEGVDHSKCGGDQIKWFKNGRYVDFEPRDWQALVAGQAKL